MIFKGNIKKVGEFWLVEVPELYLMTQGFSEDEAAMMIKDAVEMLIDDCDDFSAIVSIDLSLGEVYVSGTDSEALKRLKARRDEYK
jgi:predicted RNase H-like HicB family nuclease